MGITIGLWPSTQLTAQWLDGIAGNLPTFLLSLAAHHDDIVDPDFLAWLKARLDHLITLDPWLLVIILTLVVLAIPASIVAFYLYQQWRLRYS